MVDNDIILLGRELGLAFTTTVESELALKAIRKAINKAKPDYLSQLSVFAKNKLKDLGIKDLLPKGGEKEECFGRNFFESSRECKRCPDREKCRKVTSQTIYGVEVETKSRSRGGTKMSKSTKQTKTESKETTLTGGIKYRHVKAVVKGIRKWPYNFTGHKIKMVDGLGKKQSVPKDAVEIATKLAKTVGEPVDDKAVVRHHLSLEKDEKGKSKNLVVLDKPVKSKKTKQRNAKKRAKAASKGASKSKSMKKAATTPKSKSSSKSTKK